MLHLNFLCSCAHWQSVWGLSGGRSLFWKPLLERSIGRCPCLLTCGWLAGSEVGPAAREKTWLGPRLSLHSLRARFFFLLGCQGNPGAGRKTSHLLSTQLRETDSEKESRPAWVFYDLGTLSVFIPVVCAAVYFPSRPTVGFYCPPFQFCKTCSCILTTFFLFVVHL